MSKKYIITIKSEYEDTTRGIMVLGARDNNLYVDTVKLDDLEELNADYVNKHFGILQDDAYNAGADGVRAEFDKYFNNIVYEPVICVTSGDGYEEGKIYPLMGDNNGVHILRTTKYGDVHDGIFCTGGYGKGLYNGIEEEGYPSFNPVAYQSPLLRGSIEVGDEVVWDGEKHIVTYINRDTDSMDVKDYDLISVDGSVIDHVSKGAIVKTGRHFDIQSILEAMNG